MLTNYLKIAFRSLRRNAVYSVINTLGLALGLACTIFIALWVQDEMTFNKFHANQSQLYRVMANTHWGDVATLNTVPASINEAMKKDIPEVQYAANVMERTPLLTAGENSFKEKGYFASADLLRMFSFPLIRGEVNTALSAPDKIVITEKLAQKYFDSADVLGKTLKYNNSKVYQVSGVLKDIPSNSSLQFGWLIPFETIVQEQSWIKKWGSYSTDVYVMLKPNTSLEKINNKLKHFIAEQRQEDNKDELFLQSFSDTYLYSNFKNGVQDGGRIEYVRLFSVIAFFVLLIACINFMNLTTARSAKRAREVGIRKVIGAERAMIIRQFMGETFLLTLISVIISLLLVIILLPYFNEVTSKNLVFNLAEPKFLVTIASVTVITVILAGSYPALFLSSFKPVAVLKPATIIPGGNALLRKGLVVLQFTLSVILISGTLIIYQQISYIKNKNLGIDKENLLVIPVEGGVYDHRDAFQEELKRSLSIKSVTVASDNPIDIVNTSGDMDWEGKGPDQLRTVSTTSVGYDFLKTLGIPLVKGRDFERGRADSANYIINETAAKLMNMKEPLGQTVSFWMGKGQVIGIVKDFHLQSLHEAITPLILCLIPENVSVMLIRTTAGKTAQAIQDIQALSKKYNPAYPFEYQFMDQLSEEKYKSEMMVGQLGDAFAILTVFISCLGLFGLAAFTAEQRRKEIGIRKVLGATVSGVTALLSRDFLKLVLLSILIATPVAVWAMHKWLQSFAYRIDIQWWMFALTGLLAVFIAFITVSFQAIKAAVANPVESLRSE